MLCFVSEIEGVLICVLNCYHKSCPHKFISILDSHGFNFSISSLNPIYLTYFALCLTQGKVPVLKVEHLPPDEANLDANVLVKLLLHYLCNCVYQNLNINAILYIFILGLWSFIAFFYIILVFWHLLNYFIVSIEVVMSLILSRTMFICLFLK